MSVVGGAKIGAKVGMKLPSAGPRNPFAGVRTTGSARVATTGSARVAPPPPPPPPVVQSAAIGATLPPPVRSGTGTVRAMPSIFGSAVDPMALRVGMLPAPADKPFSDFPFGIGPAEGISPVSITPEIDKFRPGAGTGGLGTLTKGAIDKLSFGARAMARGEDAEGFWDRFDAQSLDLQGGLGARLIPGLGEAIPKNMTKADVERVIRDAELALLDGLWSPVEREQIVSSLEQIWLDSTMGDPNQRSLNNFARQAEMRRLVSEAYRERIKDRDRPVLAEGGFLGTYDGPLNSDAEDFFGVGFLLQEDENGWYSIQSLHNLNASIVDTMRNDPAAAAQLMTRMAALGMYGGGAEKYVARRVAFDAAGNPVAGTWTKDDTTALKALLTELTVMTASGDVRPWHEMVDSISATNATIGAGPGYGSGGGGGGGGGRRYGGGFGGYGGGGGGGGSSGISYTSPDLLKQLINGIARARLGYALSDEQIAAFVADYHQKEAAFVNARIAGLDGVQVDPESAAAAWVESHFRDEMAGQAGNAFIMELTQFLMSGGLSR